MPDTNSVSRPMNSRARSSSCGSTVRQGWLRPIRNLPANTSQPKQSLLHAAPRAPPATCAACTAVTWGGAVSGAPVVGWVVVTVTPPSGYARGGRVVPGMLLPGSGGAHHSRGRSGGTEPALPPGVDLARPPQVTAVEVGPQDVHVDVLGVHRLPGQEVGRALLAGGAHEQVHRRHARLVQVACEGLLVDPVGAQ